MDRVDRVVHRLGDNDYVGGRYALDPDIHPRFYRGSGRVPDLVVPSCRQDRGQTTAGAG